MTVTYGKLSLLMILYPKQSADILFLSCLGSKNLSLCVYWEVLARS